MTHEPDLDPDTLVRRVVGGDRKAEALVATTAPTSSSVPLLVTAAIVTDDPTHLRRARGLARTARERQLTALAEAHLGHQTDLLDALVRDHLVEHPDHLLASWIAGRSRPHE